ncbi:MAG: cupin [Alphaproteobacteria bacterium HGW-Alphaproteobacteria-10]|nr:MAG: cupin [Alphaproteobacteria bacterium HGW-Alphaproteobacteria-10]
MTHAASPPVCRVFRPGDAFVGKQGLTYRSGVSAETAGATALCMHVLTLQPGERAMAHLHKSHETAIYMASGVSEMFYGDRLEHHLVLREGEMLYIPAGAPHLPMNRSAAPAVAVIARTDPNEQESVVLLPHLDALIPA